MTIHLPVKQTAPETIRDVLFMAADKWLAVHEITACARGFGRFISDNATATRLAVDLKGEVESQYREGKHYKEWRLKAVEL